MANVVKLLSAVLLLCIILVQGNSQLCDLSSIQIDQTNTGLKGGYHPVFEVEVKNLCRCYLMNVSLRSEGFPSSMMVDPKLFRRQGENYLINDEKAILGLRSIKFRYTCDRAFHMTPAGL